MSNSKQITFKWEKPGTSTRVMFVVVPTDLPELYKTAFPVAVKVTKVNESDPTSIPFVFDTSYGFGAAQVVGKNDMFHIEDSKSTASVNWGYTTTLLQGLMFSPPLKNPSSDSQTIKAVNRNDAPATNIAVGYGSNPEGKTDFGPIAVYKSVKPKETVTVSKIKFTPVLRAYANVFYDEGEILGPEFEHVVPFWEKKLDEITGGETYQIVLNKAGLFSAIYIPQANPVGTTGSSDVVPERYAKIEFYATVAFSSAAKAQELKTLISKEVMPEYGNSGAVIDRGNPTEIQFRLDVHPDFQSCRQASERMDNALRSISDKALDKPVLVGHHAQGRLFPRTQEYPQVEIWKNINPASHTWRCAPGDICDCLLNSHHRPTPTEASMVSPPRRTLTRMRSSFLNSSAVPGSLQFRDSVEGLMSFPGWGGLI
ncbi:hypothetical protein C8Q74DRAFT_765510 [Fomes fomentarius]|nr:hypothetical protein C8Q74DRAFT_765510 [Fomes fomentarius]